MVDQAQITPTQCRPSNGRSELPPRAVARSTAEFLHDITTLAELQGKLLVVDLQDGVKKLVISTIMVVLGTIVALGTVPIALAALALTIAYFVPEWPLAAHFGIALLIGLVLAAALAVPALYAIKKNVWMFERTRDEWRKNMQWAKDAMRRMSQGSSAPIMPTSRWQ
jgi:uncharacterized membrane protein YqjE